MPRSSKLECGLWRGPVGDAGRADLWALRATVLLALCVTVWLAGPQAWRVLAARAAARPPSGSDVQLERVALLSAPDWLRGPVLAGLLLDFEPRLCGAVSLMDEAAALAVRDRVAESPWVAGARLERRFPDRFRIALGLRRPVLEVVVEGEVRALVDRDGNALPPAPGPTGLPRTVLHHDYQRLLGREIPFGGRFPDPRVVAAAGVAVEWSEAVCPGVVDPPALLEVDAANLGWRYTAEHRVSQVIIVLGGLDGFEVRMHYGLSHADGGPVEPRTKAAVLSEMLAEHPGLRGVRGGDLRRRNLWRNCLSLRADLDPAPAPGPGSGGFQGAR